MSIEYSLYISDERVNIIITDASIQNVMLVLGDAAEVSSGTTYNICHTAIALE